MTQANTSSASEQALSTLAHLEHVVETGRRLSRAKRSLEEWDARQSRIRRMLASEVAQLTAEFDRLTEEGAS